MKNVTVSIMAFYDDLGRIVLQDRHGISKLGEEYGFFGGRKENDEFPLEAIIRELNEEIETDYGFVFNGNFYYLMSSPELIKEYKTASGTVKLPEPVFSELYLYVGKWPGDDNIIAIHGGNGNVARATPAEMSEMKLMSGHYPLIPYLKDFLKYEKDYTKLLPLLHPEGQFPNIIR